MYLILIEWMSWIGIKLPRFFEYTSTRMGLAALTSLLVTLISGPYFIKFLYEMKIGQKIRMDECPLLGRLHERKKDTPTMGGLLILLSMLVSLVFWCDLTHLYPWILALTTFVLGGLGARDDYLKLKFQNTRGLSASKKLLVQGGFVGVLAWILMGSVAEAGFLEYPRAILSKLLVSESLGASLNSQEALTLPGPTLFYTYFVPFFKQPLLVPIHWISSILIFFFYFIVVSGTSNAVNLSDGLDGLASGCLVLATIPLIVMAYLTNHFLFSTHLNLIFIDGAAEVGIYLSALVGACLGFLWYNGYPAQVFMGDTGSLGLGGVIGVSAILLRREFLLVIVGMIFVVEALSVIIQVVRYKRNKKRTFLCAPLHHHFEYKGWPEPKVVMRFWIISLLFCLIGLLSIKLQ